MVKHLKEIWNYLMVIGNLLSRKYKNLLQQINMLDDISWSTQKIKRNDENVKKNSVGENCCKKRLIMENKSQINWNN